MKRRSWVRIATVDRQVVTAALSVGLATGLLAANPCNEAHAMKFVKFVSQTKKKVDYHRNLSDAINGLNQVGLVHYVSQGEEILKNLDTVVSHLETYQVDDRSAGAVALRDFSERLRTLFGLSGGVSRELDGQYKRWPHDLPEILRRVDKLSLAVPLTVSAFEATLKVQAELAKVDLEKQIKENHELADNPGYSQSEFDYMARLSSFISGSLGGPVNRPKAAAYSKDDFIRQHTELAQNPNVIYLAEKFPEIVAEPLARLSEVNAKLAASLQ